VTGPWWKQFVWLGARRSVRNELICLNGPSRSRALTQLLAGAVDYARAARKAGIVLPYLSIGAAEELARAHPAAHAVLHSAEATVTVPPHGVHDLMAQVSYHNRKRRRRELHEFTASGHRLTWTELTPDVAARIAPLIAATRRMAASKVSTGCTECSPRNAAPVCAIKPKSCYAITTTISSRPRCVIGREIACTAGISVQMKR
jgi:hypothetical protein